jgi:hypothetical protein
MPRHLRAIVAMAAAYVVALHSLFLAVAIPAAGFQSLFGQPICSTSTPAGHVPGVPDEHEHDCLAACMASGCGAGPSLAADGTVGDAIAWRGVARPIEFPAEHNPAVPSGASRAYDSRAPPLC